MTCRDIDDLLSSAPGNPVQAPEATEHVRKCGNCRALLSVLSEGVLRPETSETLLKRIQASVVENLEPVRPLAPSRFFLFACAIIFLCIVAIGATPFGMKGWAALSMAQKIAVFATLTGSAVLLAVSMIGQMVPGSKYALAPAALPFAILSALLMVIAATFRPRAEAAFVPDGFACVKTGLTYSIPAALLFWLMVRRGAMLFPRFIGAAAGGLAGLIGLTVLEINCPNLNVFHIMVWHGGVVFVSSAAGALLGAAVEYLERRRNQKSP